MPIKQRALAYTCYITQVTLIFMHLLPPKIWVENSQTQFTLARQFLRVPARVDSVPMQQLGGHWLRGWVNMQNQSRLQIIPSSLTFDLCDPGV